MQYVLSLPGQYQDEADEDMGQKTSNTEWNSSQAE